MPVAAPGKSDAITRAREGERRAAILGVPHPHQLARAGQTLVFPAVVTEPVRMLAPASVPPEVPVYPGATGVLVTAARDALARSQVVTYLDEGPLAANLTFYKGEMARLGWTNETKLEGHKDVGDDVRILVYTRDGAECTINFLKVDEARTRVQVTLVRS